MQKGFRFEGLGCSVYGSPELDNVSWVPLYYPHPLNSPQLPLAILASPYWRGKFECKLGVLVLEWRNGGIGNH